MRGLVPLFLRNCSLTFSYSFSMFSKKIFFWSLLSKLLTTVTLLLASNTCTTPLSYLGAILTAVWVRLVGAPPMSRGRFIFLLFISSATCTISSSEGVIRPDKPMMAALWAIASSSILSAGTITPRSLTV